MNSALFHAARPGDIGGRGRGGGSRDGVREAAALAQQMGFGGQDFGPQAANMWKMLDDLAATDKAAYTELAQAGAEEMRKPRGRFFTPKSGFVVKTSLRTPWTPKPSSGADIGKRVVETVPAGTKVFVNVCSHEGVPPPLDQADKEVDVSKEGRNATGLRMPMLVSRVRETTDHRDERALAVDVVFHPWVVDLASGWLPQEHPGLVVNRKRAVLKINTYKGGDGLQGGKPVPFPVDDASLQSTPMDERRTSTAATISASSGTRQNGNGAGLLDESMSDPRSLLAALHKPSSSAASTEGISRNETTGGAESNTEHQPLNEDRQHTEGGIAAALGLNKRKSNPTRGSDAAASDIRLPAALAGLASGGDADGTSRQRRGTGSDTCRGPLISEIVPADIGIHGAKPTADCKSKVATEMKIKLHAKGRKGKSGSKIERDGSTCSSTGRDGRPAVKKGFLSKVGKKGGASPLYPPSGSENGAEPSAYVNLMSRSKVVDTRGLSQEKVDAAMRAHADGKQPDLSSASSPSNADRTSQSPSLKTVRGAESSAAVKKGFLSAGGGGTLYGDEGSREGDSLKGRRNQHDQAFERLVVEADPDMGSAQRPSEGESDAMTEQLAELAKILGPEMSFPSSERPPSTSKAGTTIDTNPISSEHSYSQRQRQDGRKQDEKEKQKKEKRASEGGAIASGRSEPTPRARDGERSPKTTRSPQQVPAPTSTISEERLGEEREQQGGDIASSPPKSPSTKISTQNGTRTTTRSGGEEGAACSTLEPCCPKSESDPTPQSPRAAAVSGPPLDLESGRRAGLGDKTEGSAKASHEQGFKNASPSPPSETKTSARTAPRDTRASSADLPPKECEPTYRMTETVTQQLPSQEKVGGSGESSKDSVKRHGGSKMRGVKVVIDLPNLTRENSARQGIADGQTSNGASKSRSKLSSSSLLAETELDVSPRTLDFLVPGLYRLHVKLPFRVDVDSVMAKYRSSRATLTVSATEEL